MAAIRSYPPEDKEKYRLSESEVLAYNPTSSTIRLFKENQVDYKVVGGRGWPDYLVPNQKCVTNNNKQGASIQVQGAAYFIDNVKYIGVKNISGAVQFTITTNKTATEHEKEVYLNFDNDVIQFRDMALSIPLRELNKDD